MCDTCGLVIQEYRVSGHPERRFFSLEENLSRCRVGLPTYYSVYDKGLSTVIGRGNLDSSGRELSVSIRRQMWILKKWQKRSNIHTSLEQNLAKAMTELNRLSDKLNISRLVRERAAIIYRKSLEKDVMKGKTINAVVAASLYAACRVTRTPRSLQEISKISYLEKMGLVVVIVF